MIAIKSRLTGTSAPPPPPPPPTIDPYFQFTGVKNFTQMKAEINAVSDGGTVDFGGYLYEPDDLIVEDNPLFSSGSRTLTNGGITNSKTVSWSSIGNGVWATTDVDPNEYISVFDTTRVYMFDTREGSDEQPLVSQYPTAPSPVEKYRMTYNSAWFKPRYQAEGVEDATIHTTTGDNNTSGYITGFTTLVTAFANAVKAFTDGRTGSALAIIYRAGPNVISSIGLAGVTDVGGGHIRVDLDGSGLLYNGYMQFAFFGDENSMVEGEYSFDYANSRMLYKPAGGADPSNYARVIVKGGYIFSFGTGGTADNIRAFGQVSTGGQGIMRVPLGVTATVINSDVRRVSSGVAGGGYINVADSSFDWSTNRLIATLEGVTIERSVFSNSEGASAVLVQASTTGGAIAQTIFRDNAISLPS